MIKRASKAAALAFATATMSVGSAALAEDENRAVNTEAEATEAYLLEQNESFRLISLPTENGRILFMQINEDVSNIEAISTIAALADGDYSGEAGNEFAVVYLEGNIQETGQSVIDMVGSLRNTHGLNVAVARKKGSDGEPRASIMFSDGMVPSQTDMPIASERDVALLSVNVRMMAPSRADQQHSSAQRPGALNR